MPKFMEKIPTYKESVQEKIEIKDLDLGEVGKLLNEKFNSNIFFAGSGSARQVESFKVTDKNIYMLTEERTWKSDDSARTEGNSLVVLDKDLNEVFKEEKTSYDRKNKRVTKGGWKYGADPSSTIPGHESSNPESKLIKIIRVKDNLVEILNSKNEIISIEIPKNINAQDYSPETADVKNAEKLNKLLERANFVATFEIMPKTGDDYIKEIEESRNIKIKGQQEISPTVEEVLNQIEPLKENINTNVVGFKLEELGFKEATFDQIMGRAEDMGLGLCIPQVAPEISLSSKNIQLSFLLAMKPINGKIFSLHGANDGKILDLENEKKHQSFENFLFSIKI